MGIRRGMTAVRYGSGKRCSTTRVKRIPMFPQGCPVGR